ncbi:MAG: VCBS repeat-containing protein [Sandaracinaceae bacterium]|nr:VCBS repeat-containing protein [Sandaracinaceae bacterium]
MRRFSLVLVRVLVLAWLHGCDCSGTVPPAPCNSDVDCEGGGQCVDGMCRARGDGGDATRDAGDNPMNDAGPICLAANVCGTDCCDGATEECVDDACLPICASMLRCGPSNTCCPAGDLCISEACVTPGDACVEEIDCPLDAYCDASLGRCLPRGAGRCEYFPEPGVITPEEQWAWSGSPVSPASIHVMMAPVVGDLDGDGMPEVLFNTYDATGSYGGPGLLRIARGDTGEEILSIASPLICPEHGIALGDLDGDGTPEIVTMLSPCTGGAMIAFAPDGAEVWRSHYPDGSPFVGNFQFGAPTIADLEGDGRAEVIIGGAVLESDGTLRWDHREGAGSNCCSGIPRSPISTAYDVAGDEDLEVVGGNIVWNADGSVVWEDPTLVDGYIAVADFYADSIPDIVVVHQVPAGSGNGFVSIRRGTDGMVLFGPVAMPGGGRGGPPTVADFDGDGQPEIGVAGGGAYAVFDPDGPMEVLWQQPTQDTSSNITGSSVFDFDGDGTAEVVYNDECYMRIYAGPDGTVLAQIPQHSHTLIEYPLIVDVDADGNAEIVFAGNAAVNRCAAIPGYDGNRAGIRVFRDAADNWVGTRPVWNQHTYHITNVRQDLSVPAREQANWRRFNNFRQNPQSFDAPNLVPADLTTDAVGCPTSLVLTATIRNDGAVAVGAGLPVSFYLGTAAAPGRLLATERTTAPIPAGGSTMISATVMLAMAELGRDLPWFVRADDVGDGTGEQNECLEDDNTLDALYSCTGIE